MGPELAADGIEVGRARFFEHGVAGEFCLVFLDGSDDVEALVTVALYAQPWECVVIGGGVRPDAQILYLEEAWGSAEAGLIP